MAAEFEAVRIAGIGRPPRQEAGGSVEAGAHDLLLSTLASYIHAAGAEAELVVTGGGHELRYALEQLGAAVTDDSPALPSPVD